MKKKLVVPIIMLLSITTFAQKGGGEKVNDTIKSQELKGVTITVKTNIYKIDSSNTVSKLPLKDLENPQVYNTISQIVLKDQVITNLNNALKNATGITRLWENRGEIGNGGESYNIRGFFVQPTMVNGMPNILDGNIDPANIENIEVIKGPSGTLYGGSLISYGGLINIVSKKPYETFGGELGYVAGSYGLNRFTVDINTPLSKKVFARVNAAYHYEKSFQDAGFNKSFYIAPSFKINANEKLTFFINTEFLNSEGSNTLFVYLNRSKSLYFNTLDIFEKNYKKSYTSNSLTIKNPSFSIQAQAVYKLSNNWTSQTLLSSSYTRMDGYSSVLSDLANRDNFARETSKQNGHINTIDIQQNFIGNFNLGKIKNKLLIGIDYLNKKTEDYSTAWVSNGIISFVNQTDSGGTLTTQGVDKLLANSDPHNSIAETKILSAYISDVINFTPWLSAMLSLRVDNFKGESPWAADEIKSQTSLSPKFGLVYQPIVDKLSLFVNYMNGFSNLFPVKVSDIDGSNSKLKILTPEQANQWEVGAKANLYKDKISITASYYNILVSNKTMVDPNNRFNTIQGGEQLSKGFEISIVTNPIEGLSVITGFSHNKTKVTKDEADGIFLGLRPETAGPENLFNFWAMYRINATLFKGLSFGFGGNYASENKAINSKSAGTFILPSYAIFNALIAYTGNNYSLNFKVDNIADTKYYTGWSSTPQRLRTISLGITYRF